MKTLNNEAEFNAQLVLHLKALCGFAVKIVGHPQGFQERGIPDILCCHNGKLLGIEGKILNGIYSPQQRLQLSLILISGGFACGAVWNKFRQEMKIDHMKLNEKKELVIDSNKIYYKLPTGTQKMIELSSFTSS